MTTPQLHALIFSILILIGYITCVCVTNRLFHVRVRRYLFLPITVMPPAGILLVIIWYGLSNSTVALVATVMFGLLGLTHIFDLPRFLLVRRRADVQIVIASNAAFNRELRAGFNQKIARHSNQLNVVDLFVEDENVAQLTDSNEQFEGLFLEAMSKLPDYIVAHPPTMTAARSSQIQAAINKRSCFRTSVFFIESLPSPDDEHAAFIQSVYSDSKAGARLVWKEYERRSCSLNDCRLLYITGPKDSQPACIRQEILEPLVRNANGFVYRSRWWSYSEGMSALEDYKSQWENYPNIIIAENDVLALGAIDAVRRGPKHAQDCIFIGYDGIFLALAEVASPESPFKATVYSSPKQYGISIANAILSELLPFRRMNKKNDIVIPVDDNSLKDSGRARQLLGHI